MSQTLNHCWQLSCKTGSAPCAVCFFVLSYDGKMMEKGYHVMHSTKQISPEQVYDLFPYQEATDENTFFCMVIEDGGAHPYLRAGDTYKFVEDREFIALLSEIYPGCLRFSDIPYSAREMQFVLKVDPYKLVDQVLVDRQTGQPYREIMWCWGHAMCGDTILVPLTADEVKNLRKNVEARNN